MSFPARTSLLLGTFNPGKIKEIRLALDGVPLLLKSLNDFPEIASAIENGNTYLENAVLKAKFYSKKTGLLTLADDSGLEVDALGGGPGILSARFGGPNATDHERVSLLLSKLANAEDRRAQFICVIAVAGKGLLHAFEGVCRGRLAKEPAGQNGFGFDPIFIPDGYDQTFGQLPLSLKDSISHRGRALAKVREFLTQVSLDHETSAS